MEASVFVRGVVLGFSIAAPVGPIGILCIRRSVAEGKLLGFVSGLGAATADALYGCVAGFGLSVVTQLLLVRQLWLRLLGGLALCYLGLRTFTAHPAEMGAAVSRRGVLAAYLGTFVLTLANPTTILAFAAIFAGPGVASESAGSYGRTALFVVGVFIGSASWWLLLSSAAAAMREKLQGPRLVLVNRASGLTIIAFGVAALLSSAAAR